MSSDPCKCRSGSTTVLITPKRHFRSAPINGHRQTGPTGPFGALAGSNLLDHLIGAGEQRGGIVSSSDFADVLLIDSGNWVGNPRDATA